MQYLKEGVWTDFDPPQVQKANANAGSWAVSGWQWMSSGFAYRVRAVMLVQYRLDPNSDWTYGYQYDYDFQKAFP
jgi:hypothetical protein